MTTILSLLMAVAYIAVVIIKDKKLPDSISALVYALPSGPRRKPPRPGCRLNNL
jgi:hypothetical protein